MSEDTCRARNGSALKVEFTIQGSTYPFVSASEAEDCKFELAEMMPRRNGRYAEYFNVLDADLDRIVDLMSSHESLEVSLLREDERGGTFEFLVSEKCPAFTLAELGALPRAMEGVAGEGRVVAEIPPQYEPSAIIEVFLEKTADADLACKREIGEVSPLFTRSAFQQVLYSRLTDRQREVLRVAYEAGYYDWPRQATGEDVADALDITSATFSEHIHSAERKLLVALIEDRG